jgi:hypothetical protein
MGTKVPFLSCEFGLYFEGEIGEAATPPTSNHNATYGSYVMTKIIISVLLLFLCACGEQKTNDQSVLFESAIYVHWSNGYQTSSYMFGPLPGSGELLEPKDDWDWPLRGATADSVPFFFEQPTVKADRVLWRTVWIPQNTEARLLVAFRDRVNIEIARFNTDTQNGFVSQAISHPIQNPRAVDVDITDAFNTAMQRGEPADFSWQVRQR